MKQNDSAQEFKEMLVRAMHEKIKYDDVLKVIERLVEDAKWGKTPARQLFVQLLAGKLFAESKDSGKPAATPDLSEAEAIEVLRRAGIDCYPRN